MNRRFAFSMFLMLLFHLCTLPGFAFDPVNGDFTRDDPAHVRVMSYNTLKQFIADSNYDDEFARILQAVDPDIIAFQEIPGTVTQNDIETRLASLLGGTWTANLGMYDGFNRNVLATRLTMSGQITDTIPASNVSDLRGVTGGLCEGAFGATGFYVMGVHLKANASGTDDGARRQEQADAMVNWMRDARTVGDNIDLPSGTPMLILGDFNLYTPDGAEDVPYHAMRTMIEGDIYDEGTYGSDSAPDWDGSDASEVVPYDPNTGDAHTYNSSSTNPYSRLDRMVYTDSVVRVANRCVLNTLAMSGTALTNAGLLSSDTDGTSDHLPIFCDFELGSEPAAGEILINEFIYDSVGGDTREFVELINTGGRPIHLDAPDDYRLLRANSLTESAPGPSPAGYVDLVGVVPPGGIFVVYNSASNSSAIAATIESRITNPVYRQDSTYLTLGNGANSAIALITHVPNDAGDFDDTLVDGYLYLDNPAGGTQYFTTDDGLQIALAPAQSTTESASESDDSFSRNVGDFTANDLGDWTILDTETAGLPNATPSATATVSPGDVVINELRYDDDATDDKQFVELKNVSGAPINLGLLELVRVASGSVDATDALGSQILPAGGYWLLGTSASGALSATPDESIAFALSITAGDGIQLRRLSDGVVIDSVLYGSGTTHPGSAPDSGHAPSATGDAQTLSRWPDGADTDDNAADFIATTPTIGVSNGAPNQTPTNIAISNDTVNETATQGTVIGILSTTDTDFGDTHSYSFVAPESDAGGRFQLGGVSGNELQVGPTGLDYASNTSHLITIRTTDDGTPPASFDKTLTITVQEAVSILAGDIVINEIRYDDDLTDDKEFAELKNVSGQTIDLSELKLVRINGTAADAQENMGPGSLAPGEYWLIGSVDSSALEVTPDQTVSFNFQNGPDGLQIQRVSDDGVIDSVMYETSTHPAGSTDTGDAGSAGGDTNSLSRMPDGTDTDDNAADFSVQSPTPGYLNGSTNQFPTDITLSNQTVNEDEAQGFVIGTFSTTDPDGSDTHSYSFVAPESDAGGRFQIGGTNGDELQVGPAGIAFIDGSTQLITIRTTDDGTPPLSYDKTFTITIETSVSAQPGVGDIVINEIDYDDTDGDDHTFVELKNVSSETKDLGYFELVGLNGSDTNIYFTYALADTLLAPGDYWVLTVTVDSSTVTGDEEMTGVTSIQNGANDGLYLRLEASPATIIDAVSYEGDLAHPPGSSDSGSAGTDDPAEATFSLSRNPDGSDTGDNAVDFTYAEATPGEANTAVNLAPTQITLSASTVTENAIQGTLVGLLTTTDPDLGDTHSYSFVAPNNDGGGRLQINGDRLEVGATGIDFEELETIAVTIRTTDNGTPAASFDRDFVIDVTDVLPEFVQVNDPFIVMQGSNLTTTLGKASFLDGDLTSLTATLGAAPAGLTLTDVSVAGDGTIQGRLIAAPSTTVGVYNSVTLTLTDGSQQSIAVTIDVEVAAPTASGFWSLFD